MTRRPQLLGFFNEAPVFRIDTPEACARVFPPSKWKKFFPERPFRPGMQILVTGFSMYLGAQTAAEMVAELGPGLEARCSTPRLARVLRAAGARGSK